MITAGMAIRKLLLDTPAIASIVGTRIYPARWVQEKPVYPVILYYEPDIDISHHMDGIGQVETSMVQLNYYNIDTEAADVYEDLKDLVKLGKETMNTFQSGSIVLAPDTLVIQSMKVMSESDKPTEDVGNEGSLSRVLGVVQIINVQYVT